MKYAQAFTAGTPSPAANSSSSQRTPSVVARVIQYQPMALARDDPAWLGGVLVAYFVITATRTVRRGSQPNLLLDGGLLLLALVLGATSLVGGLQGVTGGGRVSGGPAVASLVNAFLLFAAAAGDARVLRHGPLTGHRRLARHLWRMCFALFSATGSFFLGQADVIPEPLRIMPALYVLAFLPLGFLFYWLWRVRSRRDPLPTLRAPLAASLPATALLLVAGALAATELPAQLAP